MVRGTLLSPMRRTGKRDAASLSERHGLALPPLRHVVPRELLPPMRPPSGGLGGPPFRAIERPTDLEHPVDPGPRRLPGFRSDGLRRTRRGPDHGRAWHPGDPVRADREQRDGLQWELDLRFLGNRVDSLVPKLRWQPRRVHRDDPRRLRRPRLLDAGVPSRRLHPVCGERPPRHRGPRRAHAGEAHRLPRQLELRTGSEHGDRGRALFQSRPLDVPWAIQRDVERPAADHRARAVLSEDSLHRRQLNELRHRGLRQCPACLDDGRGGLRLSAGPPSVPGLCLPGPDALPIVLRTDLGHHLPRGRGLRGPGTTGDPTRDHGSDRCPRDPASEPERMDRDRAGVDGRDILPS